MKRIFLMSLFILFIVSKSVSAQIKFTAFNGKTVNDNAQLLVFTASWCGACKQMKKDVFQDASVGTFINNNYTAYSIDVDKDKSGISSKFEVRGLPTFVFLSPNGELLYKGVGYADAEEFLKKATFSIKKSSGKLTDSDRLYECLESESNCDEMLMKYLNMGKWKESEDAAIVVIDMALNSNSKALDHVLKNKEAYKKIISNELWERALFLMAIEEMKDILSEAFEKNSSPDWNKVEKILKKYNEKKAELDLYGIKAEYLYELKSWSGFINATKKHIEIAASYETGDKKSKIYFDAALKLMDNIDNYEGKISKSEEKLNYETIYEILLKAEKHQISSNSDLYYELWSTTDELGLAEADFYYLVYEKVKAGKIVSEAKKEAKSELEEED